MIHGVEKLVFVDETPDHEVYQAENLNQFGIWENAINNADCEYKESLGQIEAITEYRRLDQFRIVLDM